MRNSLIQTAVLAALGMVSAQAMATGLVALPTTGFSVGGNTSPYTLCSSDGNFGSGTTTTPDATTNNTCAVFPTNSSTSPVSGYSLVASNTTDLNINDAAHTNNTTIKVGTLRTYMWRNTTTNMCIFGARLSSMTGNDYDLNTSGVQSFEVNDFTYGGFAAYNGSSSVNAGYFQTSASGDSVAYRIGRTFTAVQHRGTGSTAAAGYVAQPLTTSAPTPPGIVGGTINGLTSYPTGTPTAAQQAAGLHANWVTFTTDANAIDDDGTSFNGSPEFYVEAACPSATYTTTRLSNVLRFRQTGQETGDLIEITASGYVPGTGSTASIP